jgi:death-on-curing protein
LEKISLLRDRGAVEAAVARPARTFGGEDLYPDVPAKAAALIHSLVLKHGFVDGNKRVAVHAAVLFAAITVFVCVATLQEIVDITLEAAGVGLKPRRWRSGSGNGCARSRQTPEGGFALTICLLHKSHAGDQIARRLPSTPTVHPKSAAAHSVLMMVGLPPIAASDSREPSRTH